MHGILRERWVELEDEDKHVWRRWASWDKKRYERDLAIYEEKNSPKRKESEDSQPPKTNGDNDDSLHVPKKRKSHDQVNSEECFAAIPKKKKGHS